MFYVGSQSYTLMLMSLNPSSSNVEQVMTSKFQ
ncbi:hypothetical protein PL2TA16_04535 [Pseudoalteromonas luteoviolacea 2ta16]|uniref:Uncharacterized protein n=1 Tax=Pseudoalteromonas luteoviolacea (strain 2ta16) TaxID=1353533 RepID=V4I413_PSEL2|nr:hypothetical protein PL2TA16_04535 [Pseudoalteromonas luteoviolacea 2ta16]